MTTPPHPSLIPSGPGTDYAGPEAPDESLADTLPDAAEAANQAPLPVEPTQAEGTGQDTESDGGPGGHGEESVATFESLAAWTVKYDGYGYARYPSVDALHLAPTAATEPGATHAGLVTSTESFGSSLTFDLSVTTVRQLRSGSEPNAWEVGWAVWQYTNDHSFYYFILKPNGWELGKVDNAPNDANGPECVFPAYENCRYPGAQRFLATGSSPAFSVGTKHRLAISQTGSEIRVSANGTNLTTYVDVDNPLTHGYLGLYTEDAEVLFEDVALTAG